MMPFSLLEVYRHFGVSVFGVEEYASKKQEDCYLFLAGSFLAYSLTLKISVNLYQAHGIILLELVFFIAIGVRNSNPTMFNTLLTVLGR
jgi:hypothetical protein